MVRQVRDAELRDRPLTGAGLKLTSTLKRYLKQLVVFLSWASTHAISGSTKSASDFDRLMARWVEFLWASSMPQYRAVHAFCAIKHLHPRLYHSLHQTRYLLSQWSAVGLRSVRH
jgi:hypothetical protein